MPRPSSPYRLRLPRRAVALLAAAGIVLSLGGCGSWNWRGSGFRDDLGKGVRDDVAKWGETQRAAEAPSGDMMGLSAKSQQVERNLGVR